MGRKKKRTITGTHFVERQPNNRFTEPLPTHPIPARRTYIRRMTWNFNAGVRYSVTSDQIAGMIRESALPDAVFFIDTCFFRAPLDQAIWDELTRKHVVIPSLARGELNDWLASRGCNPAIATVVQQLLRQFDSQQKRSLDPEEYQKHAFDYYHRLLLLRKLVGVHWAGEFEAKHGRKPTKNEFFPGFKNSSDDLGDRAARIAWKGACDFGKKNYLADEQLVTMAVLHALITGRETTILTRDHDLMEQFYKLIFLVDTHYMSMLFANAFAHSSSEVEQRNRRLVCEGREDFCDDRFVGNDDIFVRPHQLVQDNWRSLLPESWDFVNIGCRWFADGPTDLQSAEMTFCADMGMADVLRTKAATNGLNTAEFGEKNCHIWPCPEMGNVLGPCAAIVTDKLVDYYPKLPPYRVLDTIHAIHSDEGFDSVEIGGDGKQESAPQ